MYEASMILSPRLSRYLFGYQGKCSSELSVHHTGSFFDLDPDLGLGPSSSMSK